VAFFAPASTRHARKSEARSAPLSCLRCAAHNEMFRSLFSSALRPAGGERDIDQDGGRDATTVPRTDLQRPLSIRFPRRHAERHHTERVGWLRAAVLGANDGLVSTASLVVGVAAASSTQGSVLVAGVAGLVAGAMSMAAGEYVSVHSQADTENADLSRERAELEMHPVAEHRELAAIYVGRGLEPGLAQQVAEQLMAHDALGAHARDELGIPEALGARPVQAALTSAASFPVGAALPLAVTALAPERALIPLVAGTSLAFLAALGAVAACVGGADMGKGAWRVTFWGALAMAITAGAGALFGTLV
jgi:VIT1/CCC1 family predicted Fe2+/Mn2+ transporter